MPPNYEASSPERASLYICAGPFLFCFSGSEIDNLSSVYCTVGCVMLVCYLPIILSYLCIPKVFKIPALSLVFWHFVCQAGFAVGLVISYVNRVTY
jgi:hypothetical protein